MLVEFSTRHVDGIAVVDVKGSLRLRGEECASLLPRYVSDLIGQGNKKILLNLEGVTKHDNTGVGELIVCQTVVRKRGRTETGQLEQVNARADYIQQTQDRVPDL
jgi:anti-anti-sigma regulatory factor